MTHPTEVKLPESLEVVAWLTSWPKDKVRPAGTIVNRQEPKLKFDCNQYSPLVRLSDAESALKARDAEIERLRGDAERYQLLRRGQKWSVIDGIGNTLRADELDAAIDQARAEGGGVAG